MPQVIALLARALQREAGLDKAEASDAMFWLRQLLAIMWGIACGVVAAKGLFTFVVFLGVSFVGGSLWIKYQDLDPEDFPETQPIQMEGFMQSIPLFVLCWVTSYSLTHF